MKQADFQQAMQGTNAAYTPYTGGAGVWYQLIAASVEHEAIEPAITVKTLDERGFEIGNVEVWHVFPEGGLERRQHDNTFHLGGGSKTPAGQPGPDEIVVGALNERACDRVYGMGIPNLGRDGYVWFHLTYQRVSGNVPPPPSGDVVTELRAISNLVGETSSALFMLEKRLDAVIAKLGG